MPSPAPELDWLDRTLDCIAWATTGSAHWLFDLLCGAVIGIVSFALHHWLLTAVIVLSSLARTLWRRQYPNVVLLRAATHDWLRTRAARKAAERTSAAEKREEAWLQRARQKDFEQRIAGLRRRMEQHRERAAVLSSHARNADVASATVLSDAAAEHEEAATRLADEIRHWEALWERQLRRNRRQQVVKLVERLVTGSDLDAKRALTELNKIWRKVEWRSLLPRALTAADERRALQLLEIMASNAHVGEARNAFAFFEKILSSYGHTWGKAA